MQTVPEKRRNWWRVFRNGSCPGLLHIEIERAGNRPSKDDEKVAVVECHGAVERALNERPENERQDQWREGGSDSAA